MKSDYYQYGKRKRKPYRLARPCASPSGSLSKKKGGDTAKIPK